MVPKLLTTCAILGVAVFVIACSGGEGESTPEEEMIVHTIELASPAFDDGEPIPAEYTCDGEDRSPPLKWANLPEGTESIALIVDAPDAPGRTFVHWVLYGIAPDLGELAEGAPGAAGLAGGAGNGTNDFRRSGYSGPCPPRGENHRYFFKLYAVDAVIELEAGAKKEDLLNAMEGKILAEGRLMGTYQRR